MNQLTSDIFYIGVNDYTIDLFENQYPVPKGVTYNSYLILDEKVMVIATTGREYIQNWMDNTEAALQGRKPDYLLIQHMEPDHSAAVDVFMKAYPDTVIVGSKGAFNMMKNYFGTDYAGRNLVIKEGDTLNLGTHELTFLAAPMVHWPEVMLAYDRADQVLFSADAFGRFGAPSDPEQTAASSEFEAEEWLSEARRYYIGIVGKHGPSVVTALKKAADLEIRMICSLHGPVLTKNLASCLEVYGKWASYEPEKQGIAVCYSSVYGHTKEAVELLISTIRELWKGINHCENPNEKLPVEVFDLARCRMSDAVAAAFEYDRVVLATTTYNNGIFPCMKDFINHLKDSAFQKRTVGLMENGSWAPKAAAGMKELLADCPDLQYCDTTVTIKSSLNDEGRAQIAALAKELLGA